MIGLYLLTTKQLEKDGTIKFGMSMRLEYRWIDYLVIFNDSKYIYYYEILDNLTRNQILDIEDEIIELHKFERNYFFKTEYFYCKDYNKFHQSIINILEKRKVNYKFYNIHDFYQNNYDNKPESFESNIHKLTPRIDQNIIIEKSYNYFQNNEKALAEKIVNQIQNYL